MRAFQTPLTYRVVHVNRRCKQNFVNVVVDTVFSPINEHSKRRTPLISGQVFFHRLNSDQSLIKNFLKGGQVINEHCN